MPVDPTRGAGERSSAHSFEDANSRSLDYIRSVAEATRYRFRSGQPTKSKLDRRKSKVTGTTLAEYKNPNQQGGGKQDSRSLLIFTAVFLAILLGMEFFRPKKPAAPAPEKPAATQTTNSAKPGAPAPASSQGANASNRVAPAAVSSTPPTPEIAAAQESTTTIENELYKITFSNRGGQVTSWILKKYTDYADKPLNLVNIAASKKFGYPLSLYSSDTNLRRQMADALYVSSATGTLTVPGQLTYEYSAGGLDIRKTFHFDNSYVIRADVTVTRDGQPVDAMLAWPAGFGDQRDPRDYSSYQKLDRATQNGIETTAPKKVVNGSTQTGPMGWGGVSDLYFAAIFLPDKPADASFVALNNSTDVPKDPDEPNGKTASQPVLGAAVGSTTGTISVRIFAGPKTLSVLSSIKANDAEGKATGRNLVPLVQYGVFSIVAKPLFYLLRWIHLHVVSNWGWAILLVTLILTLAMFPTRFTMMKSSIKMQRIQPQMNAIKEKYKKYKFDDPRKQDMNKEMQQLYKTEGVNMFGGCLPMLIQLPLIWAFYEMLENAIELRNAHWYWLHDLSSADPYHILPVVLVATTFFYQLFTPSPGVDQAQQKMMAFTMPLFSGFIAWHYASGLALYWAGSNLIGVGQQMMINRTKLGKELRDIQLKRAMKKKGGKQPALARR
jgi:YidC/Oxa1 family membrane protein insertase